MCRVAEDPMHSRLQHAVVVNELRSRLAEATGATASAEQRASSAEALVVELRQLLDDANGLIQVSDRRKEMLYSQVTRFTSDHAASLDMHQCRMNRHGRHSSLMRCRKYLPLRVLIHEEHRPSCAQPQPVHRRSRRLKPSAMSWRQQMMRCDGASKAICCSSRCFLLTAEPSSVPELRLIPERWCSGQSGVRHLVRTRFATCSWLTPQASCTSSIRMGKQTLYCVRQACMSLCWDTCHTEPCYIGVNFEGMQQGLPLTVAHAKSVPVFIACFLPMGLARCAAGKCQHGAGHAGAAAGSAAGGDCFTAGPPGRRHRAAVRRRHPLQPRAHGRAQGAGRPNDHFAISEHLP